jgi:hypothetical protein
MFMLTGDNRSERRTRWNPWRGVIFFALGVIGLSSSEIWLIARIPDSTDADYVSLASDLTLVLRQGMRDTSAKISMWHGLVNARSADEKGAPGCAQ